MTNDFQEPLSSTGTRGIRAILTDGAQLRAWTAVANDGVIATAGILEGFSGAGATEPWIVPAAHVPDPGDLRIVTRINGTVKQDGSTSRLVWDMSHIVRSASAVMTLRPGDIILTGTPDGVGQGRQPPEFLAPGDVVEIEIEGIGSISTPMVAG